MNRARILPIIRILIRAWVVLLTVLAVTRLMSGFGWTMDLLAMASPIVAAPAGLTAVILLAVSKRFRREGLACVIIAFLAAWPLLQTLIPIGLAGPTDGARASILIANVHDRPHAIENLRELALREKPDVIVVIEVSRVMAPMLAEDEALKKEYPFASLPTPGREWSRAIFSRWPLHTLRFEGDDDRYQFHYTYHRSHFVEHPDLGRFLLTALHPPSPRTPDTWRAGNQVIRLTGEIVEKYMRPANVPIVIAGDFNTTPAGYRYRLMKKSTGLHACDHGGGPVGSWPSDWPGLFRLPLDQVWGSEEVIFTSRRVLEDIGSDHRPILVSFTVPGR